MSHEQEEQKPDELLDVLDEAQANIEQLAEEAGVGVDDLSETADRNNDDREEFGTSLQEQLDTATAKAEENWDLYLRAKAEMDNLRRRTERELENAHKYATEKFAKELLAVIDSLELGIQAAQDLASDESQKLREGSELTLKLMFDVMEKFSIKQIEAQDQAFNPELHQAMVAQPSADVAPDTVLQVLQKGYQIHDRLLRPALVIVSKAP